MMKGKTLKEICKTFNIKINYTPEEEQQGSDGEPMGAFEIERS